MIADQAARAGLFGRLARRSGALALLAVDQRESLRTLLSNAGLPAGDDALSEFKIEVTRVLSPLASGVLIDPAYGLDQVLGADAIAPSCGLVVAADRLHQSRGQPVAATEFDRTLDCRRFIRLGAVALKLLVLWRRDEDPSRRQEMVAAFVQECARLGLLSVVEGVVRGPDGNDWDRDADVVAAAREFGELRPDLYKAEVPTLGHGSQRAIERVSREISDALPCPWVVLSAGVLPDAFPPAVEAACRGGASGFLAGRGIWGPSIGSQDVRAALSVDAARRFRALTSAVDAHGVPWSSIGT